MQTHELINVLNHFPPHSEWDGGDVVTTPDGKRYSLLEASAHMTPGHSTIAPAELNDGGGLVYAAPDGL